MIVASRIEKKDEGRKLHLFFLFFRGSRSAIALKVKKVDKETVRDIKAFLCNKCAEN